MQDAKITPTSPPPVLPVVGFAQEISLPLPNVKKKPTVKKKIREGAFVAAEGTIALLKKVENINDPYGASAVASIVREFLEAVVLARANCKQLKYLAERAQTVAPHLERIGQSRSKQNVSLALKVLLEVVQDCIAQAKKYTQKNYVIKVIRSGTDQEKFTELNTRLSEAITPLILGLAAEANVMLEQNLLDSLADKRELLARQEADKKEIIENLTGLIEKQKKLLEKKQIDKDEELKKTQIESVLTEKERHVVIGSQIESVVATLASNLSLDSKEKIDFFKVGRSNLSQIEQRQEKPPINQRLLIPFHEINIEKKIAEGSFGLIYQGTWCEIPVVAKRVSDQSHKKEDYEQFIREVNIMAQLRNPHVTQLYGACLEPDACLIMEYMEKGSLEKLLGQKILSLEEQRNLGLDIAKGLLYLHTREVLHPMALT